MPPLTSLLDALRTDARAVGGRAPESVNVSHIAYDSREVRPGSLFVAVPGHVTDGHRFLGAAIGAGAVACIVERPEAVANPEETCVIAVNDARRALAIVSAAFHDWPGHRLTMVGVTGTNGKTTTTTLIESMLAAAGRVPGLIGTIHVKIGGEVRDARNTTPESLDLQQILGEMVTHGHDCVSMEVSSHALALERVTGCDFAVAVFTNLTQDHLDFHVTMDAYKAAKQKLFTGLRSTAWAVVNADDPHSADMAAASHARVMRYGVDTASAEVRAVDVRHEANGTRFHLVTPAGEADVSMRLCGRFNVYNALAAAAAALALDVPLATVAAALETVPPVRGRFETVDAGQPFRVIIDYAHTPDGLENIVRAARAITTGRVITVFGCGGDRDRTKRPKMGGIAAALSDTTVITSDNPRSEEPAAIIDEIVAGMPETGDRHVIVDRRAAIEAALAMARAGDCVIIAGKGHETYQIVKEQTLHFDDAEVAREALRKAVPQIGKEV